MIHLLSSFFISRVSGVANQPRNRELERALRCNLRHPMVARVSLFVDDEEARARSVEVAASVGEESKLDIAGVGWNPLKFSDLFEYASAFTGRICMVINADNYLRAFDPALLRCLGRDPRIVLVLSRHESDLSCPMVEGYGGSHDGYVFTAPIAQNVIHNSRHPVAVSGGENVIIWELQRRHTVINPCKQVVIVHEHAGAVRTRLGRVYGMRLGRCAPLIIPTETLETEDLTNWLRRTQEQEAESPGAFRRRRLEVQAFPSRRSDLPMLEIRGFDSLIEMYAPLVNEFYFIQVGANDGQSGDPIYHFVRRFRWRGITTEPQSEVFNQLQRNYETCDQVKLMNVAVAATRGKRKLYKLSFSDQRWATGLATFHRDRLEHAIRTGQVERQIDEERHKLPESREDYITTELVETMTFGALLDIDKPSELHLLQIDSEGHDAELIKQFDFARIKPKIIHYEHHAISDSDRNEASRKLEEAGYRLYRSYIDTVAVGPDVVERLRAHNGGAEIEFIDS